MSVDDELPAFVRGTIRSVWGLEILLLLRRDPDRAWSVEAIVRELRASDGLVIANLQQFRRAGLVAEAPEGVRFAPASPVLQRLCDALAHAYAERPVMLINLISAPEDRLQKLADAFRFKGDRK